ncbi:unnamed protein product [Prunus brigantina]
MDKAGRKPLILVSASGLVHELALTATPILAVTGILIYIGSFSIRIGSSSLDCDVCDIPYKY